MYVYIIEKPLVLGRGRRRSYCMIAGDYVSLFDEFGCKHPLHTIFFGGGWALIYEEIHTWPFALANKQANNMTGEGITTIRLGKHCTFLWYPKLKAH